MKLTKNEINKRSQWCEKMLKGTLKIAITYGTYDLLHIGHTNLLKRIKEELKYDILIVGVSTDKYNNEKNKMAHENESIRFRNIQKLTYVDYTIWEHKSLEQWRIDCINFKVNTLFFGSDHTGEFDDLDYVEVKYLPRTKGISSTHLRKNKEKK